MLIVRIVVVEDERKPALALQTALKAEDYAVVLAPAGKDGFFRANAESFDLLSTPALARIALARRLIIGGTLKMGYDLLLYRAFRHVRPFEEEVAVARRTAVTSGV